MFLDIILHFIWTLIGVTTGIVFGLIPGLGVLSAVSLFLLLLYHIDPLNILLFYAGLIVAIQFMGSVTATFFGIPGEPTSIPASVVGFKMFNQNKGTESLVIAGMGSLFASVASSLLLLVVVYGLREQYWLYSQKLYSAIFVIVLLYLVFINKKIITNIFLIFLGLFLGAIGNNDIQSLSLTFNQNWLSSGLDFKIFVLNCFAIPCLLAHNFIMKKIKKTNDLYRSNLKNNFLLFFKNFIPCVRGTILGWITGLIPGVGTNLCSNFAWTIEKKLKTNNQSQLMSAESANNSANISSLFPVIVLGIPILASEALIINAMEAKAGVIGFGWFIQEQHGVARIYYLIVSCVLVSFLMYFLSTNFADKIVSAVKKLSVNFFKFWIPLIILGLSLYINYLDYTLLAGIFTFFISSIIGYFVYRFKIDSIPLIFSFLIASNFLQSIQVVISIWIK